MSEQDENIDRVRGRIGVTVREFVEHALASKDPLFHADDLRRVVIAVHGWSAPASADRILRDLRRKGLLNYKVVNRRGSLYQALAPPTLTQPDLL